ncbi:VTC domain-containing protein [Tribonema minus]|uniref:VTC domain-containing protein n=1 Tax=Tribonema minus TaxID=303371 RepID=A0A836C9A4_9STRA|nr:VTC domain-containing protein [Tribonema minus]
MKFGRYLDENKEQEWSAHYMEYKKMKKIIKNIAATASEATAGGALDGKTQGVVSLSVPTPSAADKDDAGGEQQMNVEEDFFRMLELEMKKVQNFTHQQVTEIRNQLLAIDKELASAASQNKSARVEELKKEVVGIGNTFLRLEKFVNMNFTGFYKILKKHDKNLPASPPCRAFYMARLHNQSWVRGDYSDVLVTLSRMYGQLRGDTHGKQEESGKQNFIRSTKKYWVRVEDVSEVKYAILQHLPVFLQKTMGGETDSQLVNSVYLDNSQLELYHGRLDKTPGAIALRLRWYGTGGPKQVFVERKTHEDAWTGEVSVKERFIIKEEEVLPLLEGHYDIAKEEARLRAKGQSEEQIEEWRMLVVATLQAITSKQLTPTLRSQYMRTAFQIPFDATVRISLDTNLCMINDRDPGPGRWYRDPALPFAHNDITRFPHAILEVKLQVTDEASTPPWITHLLKSGMLHEVHKFSKFIHGCAVLHFEDVQAVPYWIDDTSVRQSIINSGALPLLSRSEGANALYTHLMPFTKADGQQTRQEKLKLVADQRAKEAANRRQKRLQAHKAAMAKQASGQQAQREAQLDEGEVAAVWAPDDDLYQGQHAECCECDACCCDLDACFPCIGAFGLGPQGMTMAGQRVEPKLFFANERTFIHWLHMAVTMSTVSVAVLAFGVQGHVSQYYALAMLPVSLLFCGYALYTFQWRSARIHDRINDRWDDPRGPLILAGALAVALLFNFGIKVHFKKEKSCVCLLF